MTSVDAQARERVLSAFLKLDSYMRQEAYRGYDPYDALSSPLFKLPLLRSSKLLRLSAQQVLRRIPVNVRPILGIPKGLNPVTLGLAIQAYAYMAEGMPEERTQYEGRIEPLLGQLRSLVSKGVSGDCWGYDFDWEARYGRVPAFTPTVVATGIITNGLFECYRILGNQSALQLCKSAVGFVTKDLQKTIEGQDFCYSYSPFDRQVVLNATLKGARLLAQVYSVTKDRSLAEEAKRTVSFVVRHQRPDGSWPYSIGDTRDWVDNFHTGYVLDCLKEYAECANDRSFDEAYNRGYEFYKNTFPLAGFGPKYYSNKTYPIDSTAVAQTILTLTRNGDTALALRTADWAISNLQLETGFFFYQQNRFYSNRISFMRWSNAFMLAALGYLIHRLPK